MGTLNAFQYEVLAGLATTGEIHGLGLKTHLQDRFGYDDVNHGRLYPNLDKLVDMGYIEKGTQDRRTNTYALTDDGHDCLCEWVGKLGFSDVDNEVQDVVKEVDSHLAEALDNANMYCKHDDVRPSAIRAFDEVEKARIELDQIDERKFDEETLEALE